MKKPQHCSFEHNRHAKTGLIFHSGYAAAVVIAVCVCVWLNRIFLLSVFQYYPIILSQQPVIMLIWSLCIFIVILFKMSKSLAERNRCDDAETYIADVQSQQSFEPVIISTCSFLFLFNFSTAVVVVGKSHLFCLAGL